MSDVERFQAARAHLAQVYAATAAQLAAVLEGNPATNAWAEYRSCQIAWGALVDVENTLRASVRAGDMIDDYYREGAGCAEESTLTSDPR